MDQLEYSMDHAKDVLKLFGIKCPDCADSMLDTLRKSRYVIAMADSLHLTLTEESLAAYFNIGDSSCCIETFSDYDEGETPYHIVSFHTSDRKLTVAVKTSMEDVDRILDGTR